MHAQQSRRLPALSAAALQSRATMLSAHASADSASTQAPSCCFELLNLTCKAQYSLPYQLLHRCRNLHLAHIRMWAGDYTLSGLVGFELRCKTVGILGTGAIGACAARIFCVSDPRPHCPAFT